jgi:hypothetical protein
VRGNVPHFRCGTIRQSCQFPPESIKSAVGMAVALLKPDAADMIERLRMEIAARTASR